MNKLCVILPLLYSLYRGMTKSTCRSDVIKRYVSLSTVVIASKR